MKIPWIRKHKFDLQELVDKSLDGQRKALNANQEKLNASRFGKREEKILRLFYSSSSASQKTDRKVSNYSCLSRRSAS